jgi:hypothetical protein
MRKSELVDFAWQLKEEYNELLRRVEDLQMMKDHLERLLLMTREQAGNIRTGEGEQTG